VPLLRRFCSIKGALIVLPPTMYAFTQVNGGGLAIATGVALVGQEGVVLAGADRPVVESEGVSFESLHLRLGCGAQEEQRAHLKL